MARSEHEPQESLMLVSEGTAKLNQWGLSHLLLTAPTRPQARFGTRTETASSTPRLWQKVRPQEVLKQMRSVSSSTSSGRGRMSRGAATPPAFCTKPLPREVTSRLT